jgi:hypothetical protein
MQKADDALLTEAKQVFGRGVNPSGSGNTLTIGPFPKPFTAEEVREVKAFASEGRPLDAADDYRSVLVNQTKEINAVYNACYHAYKALKATGKYDHLTMPSGITKDIIIRNDATFLKAAMAIYQSKDQQPEEVLAQAGILEAQTDAIAYEGTLHDARGHSAQI